MACRTELLAVERWILSGSKPSEIKTGTADTFEEARAKFESAWLAFASSRKPEDFQAWRDHRNWTAKKYALGDSGQPVADTGET
jgi:hypothetical protein